MLMVQSLPWAIVLMLGGMLCLGTWVACWNAVERRGRHPSHTFIDYALAYLAVAVITSFVGGQLGPPEVDGRPNFLPQLPQLLAHWPLVLFAAGGGACLAVGDIAMQYAVAFLGLAVGPPVLNALTVVIGVVLSFFLDGGLNKPYLVFSGMACATIAIFLGASAHLVQAKQRWHSALPASGQAAGVTAVEGVRMPPGPAGCRADCSRNATQDQQHPMNTTERSPEQHRDHQHCQQAALDQAQHACAIQPKASAMSKDAGTVAATSSSPADVCILLEEEQDRTPKRAVQLADHSLWLGIGIALGGGVIYSLFLPAFQIAANDVFHMLPPGTPPLSIYTANWYFSLAFTVLSVVINVWFLYKPPLGTAQSSIAAWASDHSGRGLSLWSGVLAAVGDGAQFMGGQAVGYAAAMLVMAYPVVSVLWGVLRFGEFAVPMRLARLLLWGQVAFYAAAVGLLAGSANIRADER